MPDRPILTFAQIEAYDPNGPSHRKWCPLCGDDKPKDAAHRSLSIDPSNGLWKCFRCGASGQIQEKWADKSGFQSRERKTAALRAAFSLQPLVTSAAPIPASSSENGESARANDKDRWQRQWEESIELAGTAGEKYLGQRGIDLNVAQLAGVRWSERWNGGAGSVVFPVRDGEGTVVAAQGRAVQGNAKITLGPKKNGAFSAPIELGSGRICEPLDAITPVIVLVEAPIDALSLAQCGFPALALCGTSGPSWLHLKCGLRGVVLAFDDDNAGDKAAHQMEERLKPFGSKCRRLVPDGFKDWNECLTEWGSEKLEAWLMPQLLI